MSLEVQPVTLEGKIVTLIPLERSHSDALLQAATDGALWELWYTGVPSADNIDDYLGHALEQQRLGQSLPFAVKHIETDKIIGCTRYCHIDKNNRRLEIGYTWYAKSFQRTAVNTEAKWLLLSHAFETLGVIAVEFRTHWQNRASRAAIARLGARQDGVLRNHQIDKNGYLRDTVVFSILDREWPTVKHDLQFRLSQDRSC